MQMSRDTAEKSIRMSQHEVSPAESSYTRTVTESLDLAVRRGCCRMSDTSTSVVAPPSQSLKRVMIGVRSILRCSCETRRISG